MNRKMMVLFFLAAAFPAAAVEYYATCGNAIRWPTNEFPLVISRGSFPAGSTWERSAEEAIDAWERAPERVWWIYEGYSDEASPTLGDGLSSLIIPTPEQWQWPQYASITHYVHAPCEWYTQFHTNYSEMDILLSPLVQFDHSTNPEPSDFMVNSTLVMLHEHGHAMGLGHEDDVLTTMNSQWPLGGPIGSRNDVDPHGDDLRGMRELYHGTDETYDDHDVAASTFRLVSPGTGRTIPAPASTSRNKSVSFPFTVLNRGRVDEAIQVHFYLSPTRAVDPATRYFLGSTTVSLPAWRTTTGLATVLIPANAPTGQQYLSWATDPNNGIAEVNENNNAVALVSPTLISSNRAPTPCASATPSSGYAPLNVTFDARCSSDPDGDSLTYTWDFGNGYTATGPTVTRTYMAAGTYTVFVNVKDSKGAVSSTYQTIFVRCTGNMCGEEPE